MFVTLSTVALLMLESSLATVVLPRPPASPNKKLDSDIYRLLEIKTGANVDSVDLSRLVQAVLDRSEMEGLVPKPPEPTKHIFLKKASFKNIYAKKPSRFQMKLTTEKSGIVTPNELTKQIPAPPSKSAIRDPSTHTTPVHRLYSSPVSSDPRTTMDEAQTSTNIEFYE